MFDWCIFGAFAAYLLLMLFIGFACSKRQESLGDYYLGGRRMNKWVVALSAQASDMSGWLLMGLPGAVTVAVSLLTKAPSKEIVAEFDSVG